MPPLEDSFHQRYMLRALQLARQSVGLASPNPYVGAVLVDDANRVVGEGKHIYVNVKHAEAVAIEAAGEKARGATLYLNLEPCCHRGRTGPCVDLVIKSGVRRVFASVEDPNPQVSGKGFERLRQAGIEVQQGLFAAEAHHLNEAFAWWIRNGTPLVTLKAALTLDGKVAPTADRRRPGEAYWISGAESRAHAQRLRQANDAILVGVNTVITDDPLLTDRSGSMRRRPLLRVLLDSRLRVPISSKLVTTAARDVLIYCVEETPAASELRARGVEVLKMPAVNGRLDLNAVLKDLGQRQINSAVVEGGPQIYASFLNAGLAHKAWLYYAPRIMGKGIPFLPCETELAPALSLTNTTRQRLGHDLAVEGYFHDPYATAATAP